MAIIGLSKPVIGDYTNTSGVVSYANPFTANKAIEYSVSISQSDDKPEYADNAINETDNGEFQSAEVTLKTSDIPADMAKRIMGLEEVSETYGNNLTVTTLVRTGKNTCPDLGFGIVEMHKMSGEKKYRAIFLHKVHFKIPDSAATTKGESVEWQNPEIKGTAMLSDAVDSEGNHPWMTDAWFDSEAEAFSYLQYKCGKTVTTPSGE